MILFYFKLKEKKIDLPNKIIKHIYEYGDIKRREASLFTWQHLAHILKQYYQIELTDELICFNEYGKPDFKKGPYHFSLSHSKEYGAILISKVVCGVDIEECFDNLRIADKILNEIETVEFKKHKNQIDYINRKWVSKEAYAKALGVYLTSVLDLSIDINNTLMIDKYYFAYYAENDKIEKVVFYE